MQWVNNVISEWCDKLTRPIDNERYEKEHVNSYALLKKPHGIFARD